MTAGFGAECPFFYFCLTCAGCKGQRTCADPRIVGEKVSRDAVADSSAVHDLRSVSSGIRGRGSFPLGGHPRPQELNSLIAKRDPRVTNICSLLISLEMQSCNASGAPMPLARSFRQFGY